MNRFKLIIPTKEYEKLAFAFINEFKEYNSEMNGTGGLENYQNYDEWLTHLNDRMDPAKVPEDKVPSYTYFFVDETSDTILGMTNIRFQLNEFLLAEAGHIGYSVRPLERCKGYASTLLALALEKCKEAKLEKVLLTCDKVNIASARVIQKNKGVLENEVYSEHYSEMIQRYWITL